MKKVVESNNTSGSFSFTATLTYNNSAVSGYTVFTDNVNSSNDLITDASGRVAFTLSHNGTQDLEIPLGVKLVIAEASSPVYSVTTASSVYTDADSVAESFTVNSVEADGMVTFTNTEGIVAPTNYKAETNSYWWLFAGGIALVGGAIIPITLHSKKREENN